MDPITAFRRSTGRLKGALSVLTGADGEGTRAAAQVLVKEIRARAPSEDVGDGGRASGQKRHRRPGATKRSVRQGKVDGVRRVGTDDFVAPFNEFGIPHRAKHGTMPAHPFFRPGLIAAKPKMGEAMVGAMRTKMGSLIAGGASVAGTEVVADGTP